MVQKAPTAEACAAADATAHVAIRSGVQQATTRAATAPAALAVDRSAALDAVRGVAISLVVAQHYFPASVFGMGWTGVDLFFVLSGYLLGGILIDHRDSANYFGVFYARRCFRILPLYLLLVALIAVFSELDQPVWHYLLFLHNFDWAGSGKFGSAWLLPTWSLAVEEQFYLALPLIIRFTPPRRLAAVLGLLIAAAPGCRAAAFLVYGNTIAMFALMPCRMDALFLGVLAAWAMRQPELLHELQRRRVRLYGLAMLGGAGFCCLAPVEVGPATVMLWALGVGWIAAFYTLVLLLVVTAPHRRRPPGPAARLGVGAYSIYLFHLPVLIVAGELMGQRATTIVAALAAILVLSIASWFLIERPLIRFARARWRYRRSLALP